VALFRYRGRTTHGELQTGRLEADSVDTAAQRLVSLGITPLTIDPHAHRELEIAQLWRRLGGGRPKTTDVLLFARQMHSITKSGLPLLRGLRALLQSTHNLQLREALQSILTSLESGRDLASSLARHPELFPPLFISMVRVGEATGTLDKSFQRVGDYLALDQEVRDRIRDAVRYPLVVVGVIAMALAVITVFVIPRFAPLFHMLGNDIPWPTRIIMGVSDFARHNGLWLLGALAIAVVQARRWVATDAGRLAWDRWKLRLPVIGELVLQATVARIVRSLAICLDAGLPMIQSLTLLARAAGNVVLGRQVERLRDAVERGEPVSRAAATAGLFPPLVLQMIAIGEETGELTSLLEEIAGHYRREVDYQMKNLSALIEPLLIIGVGAMVLVLALGVFLPMWNVIAKVGHGG
jgi:MSHA biogenesis protein MshG